MSPFRAILRAAVDRIPHAVGGAFAAADGEMVDSVTTADATEWAILTAHYGVVLASVEAAFGTWHFGGPEFVMIEHARLDVLIHPVGAGYYALVAVAPPAPLAVALASLKTAAFALQREMA
jgi:predicted regulator of Ras-like GTPase activity (Roadblock/LC7/MglB family)